MKNINDLREELFDTIQKVKDGKIKPEDAKIISELSQVIINSAKAENDYLKITNGTGSGFIEKDTHIKMIERPKAKYDNPSHEERLKKIEAQ